MGVVLRLAGGGCGGVGSVVWWRPTDLCDVGLGSGRWGVHIRGGFCVAGREGAFCVLRVWLY